jgi:hypothetical protein
MEAAHNKCVGYAANSIYNRQSSAFWRAMLASGVHVTQRHRIRYSFHICVLLRLGKA